MGYRLSLAGLSVWLWLVAPAPGADEPKISTARFTGSASCSSTSCHGGGTSRNEAVVFARKDRHFVSHGVLGKGTSQRIAESLGIVGDVTKAAQCIVCHSPVRDVPSERLVKEVKPDDGVACESCHGPAEPWLRLHTRSDVNFQQMVAAGLRDLNDIYGRANTCVACHLNVDEPLLRAGHPELFFELDRQCVEEPPHYSDARPALGARSWITGQAAALREISWKLQERPDERLLARWRALVWLLRKTEAGRKELPDTENFAGMRSAADRLARQAATDRWTKEKLRKLLQSYVSARAEFATKADRTELRRRAEVLWPAIDRLAIALLKEGGVLSSAFHRRLRDVKILAQEQDDFDPGRFAAALEQLEVAFEFPP